MIKHLFKLVWNRKRVNALILAEIFISFIVLCVVATAAVYHIDSYRQPLGFRYENVWTIGVDPKLPNGPAFRGVTAEGNRTLTLAIKELPEVEAIATTTVTPYSNSTWINSWGEGSGMHRTEIGVASDDAAAVFGLHLIEGRWFDRTDDAEPVPPLVINKRLADEVFHGQSPIGQTLDSTRTRGVRGMLGGRIVGVIDEFRKGGEFGVPDNFTFRRLRLNDTTIVSGWGFAIKLRGQVDPSFQGRLAKVLASTQKTWAFDIQPLERARESNFQNHLAPLFALGMIAAFLLMMVGLGLIGVLWQNVSQRTREIGLRRALGGTAEMVYRQILGELFIVATFGILAGTIVILQVPLLNLIDFVRPQVFAGGLLISLALMYLLTFVCGLYPSWLAMEVHPSEALHYE